MTVDVYQNAVLLDTPVRYYRLDESGAGTIVDSGSQQANGTSSGGVTFSQSSLLHGVGITDTSVTLDGTTGYISATNPLTSGQNATFETWVSVADYTVVAGVRRRILASIIDANNAYQLTVDANGLFVWAVHVGGTEYIMSSTGFAANVSYHLVATFTAATHALALYVNGRSVPNNGGVSSWSRAGTGLCIGRRPDGTGYFSGTVDEVAIYDKVLSSSRITAHYVAGSVGGGTYYAADTFIRANNTSSWGTASDGVTTYDNLSGNGVFAISSNEGTYTAVTSTWYVPIAVGPTTSTTVDMLFRMSISNVSSKVGAFFNYITTGGVSLYRVAFTGGTGDLRAEKCVTGGAFALVGSAVSLATITANNFYWMHIQCLNGVLRAKVWADGNSEPASWQLSVTDGSPLATGQFGFYIYEASTNTLWKFDHLTATNGAYAVAKSVVGRTKVSTTLSVFRSSMGRVNVVPVPPVVRTAGRITGETGTNTMIAGTGTLTDAEVVMRVSLSQVGSVVGATLRYQSLTSFVRLRLLASSIELVQQDDTAFTTLASYAVVPSANTKYWMKLRAVSTVLYGKIWQDGSAEPSWQIAATTTVVQAGQVGVSAALSSPTATADFSYFQATVATAGVSVPTLAQRNIQARGIVMERSPEQVNDIRARARLKEYVDVIDVTVYPAERPPLQRDFPKS